MKRHKKHLEPSTLYSIGVNYYAYGVIKDGKTALFDYYKTDGINDAQKAAILAFCPYAVFGIVRKEFAPEIKAATVAFPKAAWYREHSQGQK